MLKADIAGSYERIVAHHWPGGKDKGQMQPGRVKIKHDDNNKQQKHEGP